VGCWTLEIENGVAVITYTPAGNASLSFAAVAELAGLLETGSAVKDGVSVVVLTGSGGGFLPDGDRDELARIAEDGAGDGDALAWHRATTALRSLPQPTVAAIEGEARGGACLLALACTLRIAGDASVLGPLELGLGVVGTDISADLVRLAGPATAAVLLLTGRQVDAASAKQLGLVDELLPTDDFAARARDWCQRIATSPPDAVFAIKQAVEWSTSASRGDLRASQPPNDPMEGVVR
jgi:enoyl-CoA hydratase/carnithine racemase